MLTLSLFWSLVQTPEIGLASRYGYPGDPYEPVGQAPACKARLTAQWGRAGWRDAFAKGVAHRTHPCGTKLLICRLHTSQCTEAVVVDRGPYGAIDARGRWHMRRKLRNGERWRGIVDLLPKVAKKLGIRGLEEVSLFQTPE